MRTISVFRLLGAVFALLLFSACQRQASTSGARKVSSADIRFNDTLHDFGAIPLPQAVDSFDFVFTNTGTARLVVLGVETSCRCIKASYPYTPIEPGEASFIRVVYDGRGRGKEYFNRSVKVMTNARHDCVTLRINGTLGQRP